MNKRISRRGFVLLVGAGGAVIALGSPLLTQATEAATALDAQMKAVLDELAAFNAPPIEQLSPMNARNNPTAADAVMGVLAKRRQPAIKMVGNVNHQLLPGLDGELLARVY